MLGRKVATLVSQRQIAGSHSLVFSAVGGSASGRNAVSLPSGVYFYRVTADNFSLQKTCFSEIEDLDLARLPRK